MPLSLGMEAPLESILLTVADTYAAVAAANGGKSLARVATIVVNRGSFFEPLRRGQTCSVRNFEKLVAYFREPANWPGETIPAKASIALAGIGRPVDQAA